MKSIEDLRLKNEGLAKCCACNTPFLERSPLDRSRISINALRFHGNVLSLPKSIERSWSHRNETPWRELLELSGPGYVIGTGGSFVVASFIAQLISKNKKNIVLPIKPFDFIRMGFNVPFAILISNSGKTPDIMSAFKQAQNMGIPKVLLISGNKQLESMDILRKDNDILLYTGANEDRGFLSVLGVIIPCFLSWAVSEEIWFKDEGYRYFNDLYLKSEIKVNNNFSKYKRNVDFKISGRKSIILGGGFAWPAMLNIESKMVESNFGRPQISEIKDYSHGRFVSSMDQNVLAIVCGMPDDKEFRDFLIERLKDRNDVIEINSEEDGPIGSLELLLQSEHLMRCFTEKENIDISKPKIPRKGLELYKYEKL
jgi:fructoselysine-6-P-deglycase FrlB-like protein